MVVLDAGARPLQLRFLPDGRLLVGLRSETGECAVEVWTLPAGGRVRVPIPDRRSWYLSNQLAVSPTGDRFHLACGSLFTFATADGAVARGPANPLPDPGDPAAAAHGGLPADQVIAAPTGSLLVLYQMQPEDPWWRAAFAPDGTPVWHGGGDAWTYLAGFLSGGEEYLEVVAKRVVRRRSADGAEVAAARYPANRINQPQVSPDGRHLGVIGYSAMYVYDTAVLAAPRAIKGSANFGNFVGFAFHPAGRTLAVIHGTTTLVKLYDLDTLTLRTKLNWKVGPLTCVAFSADGLLGAAGTDDGRVVVWDVDE
ncbi:hypothetical protein J0H58_37860 [bacterium]|nr:hypothetical protein [bacterium]